MCGHGREGVARRGWGISAGERSRVRARAWVVAVAAPVMGLGMRGVAGEEEGGEGSVFAFRPVLGSEENAGRIQGWAVWMLVPAGVFGALLGYMLWEYAAMQPRLWLTSAAVRLTQEVLNIRDGRRDETTEAAITVLLGLLGVLPFALALAWGITCGVDVGSAGLGVQLGCLALFALTASVLLVPGLAARNMEYRGVDGAVVRSAAWACLAWVAGSQVAAVLTPLDAGQGVDGGGAYSFESFAAVFLGWAYVPLVLALYAAKQDRPPAERSKFSWGTTDRAGAASVDELLSRHVEDGEDSEGEGLGETADVYGEKGEGNAFRFALTYLWSVPILFAFSILVSFLVPSRPLLGFLTSVSILVVDAILMSLLGDRGPDALTSPLALSLACLCGRVGLITGGADYWFMGHCVVFLLLGAALCSAAAAPDHGASASAETRGTFATGLVGKVADGGSEAHDIPEEVDLPTHENPWWRRPEAGLAVLVAAFLVELWIVSDQEDAHVPVAVWETRHPQWLYGVSSLFVLALYGLCEVSRQNFAIAHKEETELSQAQGEATGSDPESVTGGGEVQCEGDQCEIVVNRGDNGEDTSGEETEKGDGNGGGGAGRDTTQEGATPAAQAAASQLDARLRGEKASASNTWVRALTRPPVLIPVGLTVVVAIAGGVTVSVLTGSAVLPFAASLVPPLIGCLLWTHASWAANDFNLLDSPADTTIVDDLIRCVTGSLEVGEAMRMAGCAATLGLTWAIAGGVAALASPVYAGLAFGYVVTLAMCVALGMQAWLNSLVIGKNVRVCVGLGAAVHIFFHAYMLFGEDGYDLSREIGAGQVTIFASFALVPCGVLLAVGHEVWRDEQYALPPPKLAEFSFGWTTFLLLAVVFAVYEYVNRVLGVLLLALFVAAMSPLVFLYDWAVNDKSFSPGKVKVFLAWSIGCSVGCGIWATYTSPDALDSGPRRFAGFSIAMLSMGVSALVSGLADLSSDSIAGGSAIGGMGAPRTWLQTAMLKAKYRMYAGGIVAVPSFTYDPLFPADTRLKSASGGPLLFFISMSLFAVWGLVATAFVDPPYLGAAVTTVALALALIAALHWGGALGAVNRLKGAAELLSQSELVLCRKEAVDAVVGGESARGHGSQASTSPDAAQNSDKGPISFEEPLREAIEARRDALVRGDLTSLAALERDVDQARFVRTKVLAFWGILAEQRGLAKVEEEMRTAREFLASLDPNLVDAGKELETSLPVMIAELETVPANDPDAKERGETALDELKREREAWEREREKERLAAAEERQRELAEARRRQEEARKSAAGMGEVSIEELTAVVRKLEASCKEVGAPYEDVEFEEMNAKADKDEVDPGTRRVRACNLGTNPTLYKDGIHEHDMRQGFLGNCYFVSALSTLAGRLPGQIEALIVPPGDGAYSEAGVYGVRFKIGRRWRGVVIDDTLPQSSNGGLEFGKCVDEDEMWYPLLEKAYAKAHGGWAKIGCGGVQAFVWQELGAARTVEHLHFDNGTADPTYGSGEMWRKVVEWNEAGHLLGASMPSVSQEKREAIRARTGLICNHAYSLFDAQEVDGLKLVRLRNPWGRVEWAGRFSDGSGLWTPRLRAKLKHTDAEDGTFCMLFEDFVTEFESLNVGYVVPKSFTTLPPVISAWKGLDKPGWDVDWQATRWGDAVHVRVVVPSTPATVLFELAADTSCGMRVRRLNMTAAGESRVAPTARQLLQQKTADVVAEADMDDGGTSLQVKLEPGSYVVECATYKGDAACEMELQAHAKGANAGRINLTLEERVPPTPAGPSGPVPGTPGEAVVLTADSYDMEVLQSDGVVLVDFYAPWCPPCRKLLPLIDELAKEYAGRAKVAKLCVDDSDAVGKAMSSGDIRIRGIPTVVLFKGGKLLDKDAPHDPTGLRRLIDRHLSGEPSPFSIFD